MLQYPTTNIKFPEPIIGWNNSYKLIEKYYYDDVFICIQPAKESQQNVVRMEKALQVVVIDLLN